MAHPLSGGAVKGAAVLESGYKAKKRRVKKEQKYTSNCLSLAQDHH